MKLKDWFKTNSTIFSDTDLRYLLKNFFTSNYFLLLEQETNIDPEKLIRLEEIKQAYVKGVPLAYILGKEEFLGWEFKVNNNVLIPRKETELIAEKSIEIIKNNCLKTILDLCCGSGNIAISIKNTLGLGPIIFSSDLSIKALNVAKLNKDLHKSDIHLINSDLLKGFKYKSFDLIVSNPPYVETGFINESLKHEPDTALYAGKEGLLFINRILNQAYLYLKDKSFLILEFGYKHKGWVEEFINKTKVYKIVEWIKDYSGHFRGVIVRLEPE